jgi:ATP-dependent Clp protease ATP-binding subunit ClpA
MAELFDRFTERARTVMRLSQEEAQLVNHNYIGTEHILLGLVREGEGVAAKVLANLGVDLDKVRSAVEFIIGRGGRRVTGEIGLTPRAKKVLQLAGDEAARLGHHYVGTEHILLGLIREGEGIAAGVLESLGVSLERVRSEVIKVLTQAGVTQPPRQSHVPPTPTSTGALHIEYLLARTRIEGSGPRIVHLDGTWSDTALETPSPDMSLAAVLDLLGGDGWQLAAVDPTPHPPEGGPTYIFTRRSLDSAPA